MSTSLALVIPLDSTFCDLTNVMINVSVGAGVCGLSSLGYKIKEIVFIRIVCLV